MSFNLPYFKRIFKEYFKGLLERIRKEDEDDYGSKIK